LKNSETDNNEDEVAPDNNADDDKKENIQIKQSKSCSLSSLLPFYF
jgi:hypothetical protein